MHMLSLSVAVCGCRKYNQRSKITNSSGNKAYIPRPLKSQLAMLGELESNAEIDQNLVCIASNIVPERHHGGKSSPHCIQEATGKKG